MIGCWNIPSAWVLFFIFNVKYLILIFCFSCSAILFSLVYPVGSWMLDQPHFSPSNAVWSQRKFNNCIWVHRMAMNQLNSMQFHWLVQILFSWGDNLWFIFKRSTWGDNLWWETYGLYRCIGLKGCGKNIHTDGSMGHSANAMVVGDLGGGITVVPI